MLMKTNKQLPKILGLLVFWAANLLLFNGCNDQIKNTVTYAVNEPVYMPFSEFRAAKTAQPARKMVHPGKICLYGDYLFINEINEGIHVVDNSNPANPTIIAFIELLGNMDVTIKDNLLYADSYIDLVCFDISRPAQAKTVGRAENVFPYVFPPVENDYPVTYDLEKGIVVDWEVKTVTEKEEFRRYYPCPGCYYSIEKSDYSWASLGGDRASSVNSSAGTHFKSITGSMSRFAAYGDYLYVVNSNSLKSFTLSESTITKVGEVYLGWNVETIFPYDQKLFLGTTNGLLIYSLGDPSKPTYLSSLSHVLGCDPVVVQGDYAYVTIRGGNVCGQNLSLLDVVDIANPSAPVLKASFGMKEPYGLGIDGNTLFVCDKGLSIFDASDPLIVGSRPITQFTSIDGYDVIPYNDILILIGNDGLYQYDYSDINNIKLLSALKVDNN